MGREDGRRAGGAAGREALAEQQPDVQELVMASFEAVLAPSLRAVLELHAAATVTPAEVVSLATYLVAVAQAISVHALDLPAG